MRVDPQFTGLDVFQGFLNLDTFSIMPRPHEDVIAEISSWSLTLLDAQVTGRNTELMRFPTGEAAESRG